MGRKRKQHDELEALQHENKELKSIVKSLERQVKKLNKEYKNEYSQDNLIEEDYNARHVEEKCEKCGKGHPKKLELGPRTIITCDTCDFRRIVKQSHGKS